MGASEQESVRAAWEEQIEDARKRLRLDEEFAASGRPYAELDKDGEIVVRRPKGKPSDPK